MLIKLWHVAGERRETGDRTIWARYPAITRITAGGTDVTIGAVDRIPIRGHQGPGSITDLTIRRLLTLQGATQPSQIISSMTCKGQSTTISLPDHADRIDVAFTPLYGQNPALAAKVRQVLQPDQWVTLINRIGHIPEPTIPLTPSAYAITAR